MPFCANCGTMTKGAARYCTQCGAPLEHQSPQDARDSGEALIPEPWFPEEPAAGPWFRDEHAAGPRFADEQSPGAWPTHEQSPGAWPTHEQHPAPGLGNDPGTPGNGPADQSASPAAREPLTLSEPVWVTDFFQHRPPEADLERPQPAYPSRHPPGWAGRVTALAAVVVLLGGGLITWRLAGGQPAPVSAGQPSNGAGKSAPASPVAPSTAASPPVSPSPTTWRRGRGRNAVALAPALAHTPAAQQVVTFLQTYFWAINQRDYTGYTSLLAHNLRPTVRQFEAGYRSTSDSGAVLTSLSASRRGLAAVVTFISHQDRALSPDHSACTKWDIILYLRRRGSSYLIVPPPHGYRAAHQPCV
jgi:hypothetical protein